MTPRSNGPARIARSVDEPSGMRVTHVLLAFRRGDIYRSAAWLLRVQLPEGCH